MEVNNMDVQNLRYARCHNSVYENTQYFPNS